MEGSEFLAPLCLPGLSRPLLTIFTIIFLFFFFKVIPFEHFKVATKGSPITLGLDKLFTDAGE